MWMCEDDRVSIDPEDLAALRAVDLGIAVDGASQPGHPPLGVSEAAPILVTA
jgi:hypothetical protein